VSVPGDGLVVEVEADLTVVRVAVDGELDLATAGTLRTAVEPALTDAVERLEVDFERVSFIDSSGLSVVLELAARLPVRIVAASPSVRRIIEVTGLDDLLGPA
jgi:anti-sigma B factor antagonist